MKWVPRRTQAQYVVYTEEQLRERKKRSLAEVTSVLSIPDADAIRVLRLFKWCGASWLELSLCFSASICHVCHPAA